MRSDVTKKNKHLTLEDRIEIQGCLDKGMTFKAIAERVGKDQTTICIFRSEKSTCTVVLVRLNGQIRPLRRRQGQSKFATGFSCQCGDCEVFRRKVHNTTLTTHPEYTFYRVWTAVAGQIP